MNVAPGRSVSSKRQRAWDSTADRGWNARSLIYAAIVLNLLLFVRVAVIRSPFYSYQGPSGADRVYYYAYARSLVIDRDLNFSNEFAARPPSSGAIVRNGRQLNKYPIGTPLIGLPAFAVIHAVVSGLRTIGVGLAADGYSAPYVMAFTLSQLGLTLLGMWLLYLTLLRYFAAQAAAIAVVAAWFGTNALHYTAVDLMMAHAAALFSTAWCGYESVTLGESSARPAKWCRVGLSCALVGLVRYQNVVFLLVPAAATLAVLSNSSLRGTLRTAVLNVASATLGFVVAWLPQLAAWKAMFGSWLVNSYQQELEFTWTHPHVRDMLFRDPARGLAIWLPVLGIGVFGCLAYAAWRVNAVALAAVVAWLINFYIISAWWAWSSVAQRATFDFLLPVAVGLGAGLTAFRDRRQVALIAALAMLIAWSVPFAAIGVPEEVSYGTLASAWLECMKALL
ncbi:MAG: hypothetical protein ABJA98_04765 [Acidobacteriota bacterium]